MLNESNIVPYRILKNNVVITEGKILSLWLNLVYGTFVIAFKNKEKVYVMEVFIKNKWIKFYSSD